MSIVSQERVTMQATPQDITGGIPNDRDAAETEHVHPGQEHDMSVGWSVPTLSVCLEPRTQPRVRRRRTGRCPPRGDSTS